MSLYCPPDPILPPGVFAYRPNSEPDCWSLFGGEPIKWHTSRFVVGDFGDLVCVSNQYEARDHWHATVDVDEAAHQWREAARRQAQAEERASLAAQSTRALLRPAPITAELSTDEFDNIEIRVGHDQRWMEMQRVDIHCGGERISVTRAQLAAIAMAADQLCAGHGRTTRRPS